MSLRSVRSAGGLVVAVLLGATMVWQLLGYHVPVTTAVGCGMAFFVSALELMLRVREALTTATFHCTHPGCDYQVRLSNVDSAEAEYWRGVVESHPHPGGVGA